MAASACLIFSISPDEPEFTASVLLSSAPVERILLSSDDLLTTTFSKSTSLLATAPDVGGDINEESGILERDASIVANASWLLEGFFTKVSHNKECMY